MRFENVREVEVSIVNGRIELEGWGESHAEVTYTVHGEVNVEVEQRGSRLVIREEPRKRFHLFGGREGWAEIGLKVPMGVPVKLGNVNGEVKARNVLFTEASTVNGEITLENCKVEKLSTVNGRIKAHLPIAGPLKASTVNGEIELTVEELEGNVEIGCVNGSVTLRLSEFCDARIKLGSARGSVELIGIERGVIGTGEFEVKVGAVNGSVRVELI
ncbi:DUF4097 family beta strand repeat-containing protein [Thermococcus sp.]